MSDDIQYVMARIKAMEDARKNLARAIKEDKEYVREAMGEREVLETPAFTAKIVTRTSTRLLGIEHIRNLLDKITKKSESKSLSIKESLVNFEPFEVEDLELVPDWAKQPYITLQARESIGES